MTRETCVASIVNNQFGARETNEIFDAHLCGRRRVNWSRLATWRSELLYGVQYVRCLRAVTLCRLRVEGWTVKQRCDICASYRNYSSRRRAAPPRRGRKRDADKSHDQTVLKLASFRMFTTYPIFWKWLLNVYYLPYFWKNLSCVQKHHPNATL